MVIDDGHLRSILRSYFEYYHRRVRNGPFERSRIISGIGFCGISGTARTKYRSRQGSDLVILSRDVHKTDLEEI